MVTGLSERSGLGVLSLQGDFAEHLMALSRCGVEGREVRTPSDLEAVDALIIPGGESTAILKLIDDFDLREALTKRIRGGMGVFGTCAGAIVLANESQDGETPLGVLELRVERNAYGRQVDSFETDLEAKGMGIVQGVFIRAPLFAEVGHNVEILAEFAGSPVLVRSENILASAFHPELTEDLSIHRFFLSEVCEGI